MPCTTIFLSTVLVGVTAETLYVIHRTMYRVLLAQVYNVNNDASILICNSSPIPIPFWLSRDLQAWVTRVTSNRPLIILKMGKREDVAIDEQGRLTIRVCEWGRELRELREPREQC